MKVAANVFQGLVLAVLACVTVAVSGCATTPEGDDRERFAVEAGIVLILENSGRPAERAAEIVEAVDKLQNILLHEQTTVGELRSALLKRVNERELSPGEKVLALQVVARIAEQFERRVGSGILSPHSVISIDRALGYAENMAALYVQK